MEQTSFSGGMSVVTSLGGQGFGKAAMSMCVAHLLLVQIAKASASRLGLQVDMPFPFHMGAFCTYWDFGSEKTPSGMRSHNSSLGMTIVIH